MAAKIKRKRICMKVTLQCFFFSYLVKSSYMYHKIAPLWSTHLKVSVLVIFIRPLLFLIRKYFE